MRWIFSMVMLAVTVVVVEQRASCSDQPSPTFFGVRKNGRPYHVKWEKFVPPPLQRQIEQTVLKHLSEGRQAEAEKVLSEHVEALPDVLQTLAFLRNGDQKQALKIVKNHADIYRANHRLFYWYAACERSRFDIQEAIPRFILAGMANERTMLGQSTFRIIGLDGVRQFQQKPDDFFAELEKMTESHPDEIAVRWMLAVECRSYNRNEQGVVHYQKILEKWNPGPVLVHQTFANLLDQLHRYDEALVERRKAVAQEPAGWSYDGLANTLHAMQRFDEANEAHSNATSISPRRVSYWLNWCSTLLDENRPDEAIEKCKKAMQLEPKSIRAIYLWSKCQRLKEQQQSMVQKANLCQHPHFCPQCGRKTHGSGIDCVRKRWPKLRRLFQIPFLRR